MIINTEIFDKVIVDPLTQTLKREPWFVLFHVPWCLFCQDILEDWEKFYSYRFIHTTLNLGKIDCTDNEAKPLCVQYEIGAYPTILYFAEDNRWYEYLPNQKLDDIPEWIMDKSYLDEKNYQGNLKDMVRPEWYEMAYKNLQMIIQNNLDKIDRAFEENGMRQVPVPVRYISVLLSFILPVLTALYMACQKDQVEESRNKQTS